MTTPTGAALLTTLAKFGRPAFNVHAVGVGLGSKDPEGFPNALRVWLGETSEAVAPEIFQEGRVVLLETNLDDAPGCGARLCPRETVRAWGPGRLVHPGADEEKPARRRPLSVGAQRAGTSSLRDHPAGRLRHWESVPEPWTATWRSVTTLRWKPSLDRSRSRSRAWRASRLARRQSPTTAAASPMRRERHSRQSTSEWPRPPAAKFFPEPGSLAPTARGSDETFNPTACASYWKRSATTSPASKRPWSDCATCHTRTWGSPRWTTTVPSAPAPLKSCWARARRQPK